MAVNYSEEDNKLKAVENKDLTQYYERADLERDKVIYQSEITDCNAKIDVIDLLLAECDTLNIT